MSDSWILATIKVKVGEPMPNLNVHRPAWVNLTAKRAKFAKILLLNFAFFAVLMFRLFPQQVTGH